MRISGFACSEPGGGLQPFQYEAAALGPMDIAIAVTHCGICHSDAHLIDNDWRISKYPFIPGHEIVGKIKAVGELVTDLKIGQRVGVGWLKQTCMACESCLQGNENFCENQKATCVGNHGGFADSVVVDSRWAFAIPDEIDSESAAPLMCAGITVFSPLRNFQISPTMKVGVIGIGGLGHLALQFAKAFGCEVTAFSRQADKAAEAKSFGADNFVLSDNLKTAAKKLKGSFDCILSTADSNLDWNSCLSFLKPKGRLCLLGVPNNDISFNPSSLIHGGKTISGSSTGNRARMREMLAFAARHGIKPQTEVVPIFEINEAIVKVRENRVRYRIVLKII